jgi:hypothetical protein
MKNTNCINSARKFMYLMQVHKKKYIIYVHKFMQLCYVLNKTVKFVLSRTSPSIEGYIQKSAGLITCAFYLWDGNGLKWSVW